MSPWPGGHLQRAAAAAAALGGCRPRQHPLQARPAVWVRQVPRQKCSTASKATPRAPLQLRVGWKGGRLERGGVHLGALVLRGGAGWGRAGRVGTGLSGAEPPRDLPSAPPRRHMPRLPPVVGGAANRPRPAPACLQQPPLTAATDSQHRSQPPWASTHLQQLRVWLGQQVRVRLAQVGPRVGGGGEATQRAGRAALGLRRARPGATEETGGGLAGRRPPHSLWALASAASATCRPRQGAWARLFISTKRTLEPKAWRVCLICSAIKSRNVLPAQAKTKRGRAPRLGVCNVSTAVDI